MKAATETLDRIVVERPTKNQNLCLDKGYDYPEIEREAIKRRYVPHIRQRCGERIDKDRICNEEMGCRKNKLDTRFRKLVIGKVRKEIRELSYAGLFSLLYYCLQENIFGIGSNKLGAWLRPNVPILGHVCILNNFISSQERYEQ
jgi:hypothetical protein